MNQQGQARVILWGTPRSMTTAFFRSICNGPKTYGIFEPYVQAYHYGEERQSLRLAHRPPKSCLTYMDVKSTLEQDYSSNDVVFVKGLSYTAMGSPGNAIDILPKGYIHTFLIRHPERTIMSLYKASTRSKDDARKDNWWFFSWLRILTGWGYFVPKECGVQDLYKLYQIVTETLKQETIIIDADDLLKDPESAIRRYCDFTGIEYAKSMIEWNTDPFEVPNWDNSHLTEWFKSVCATRAFLPPRDAGQLDDTEQIGPELRKMINDSIPYYMELYKKRTIISPQQN